MSKLIMLAITGLCLLTNTTGAQAPVIIPAYTAYAWPTEVQDDKGNSLLFEKQSGIRNWTDKSKKIIFFFKVRKAGALDISLSLKNSTPGNQLEATIAGKAFKVRVPASRLFMLVKLGTLMISDTGFYSLTLSPIGVKSKTIAEIRSLQLSGPAATGVHFNPDERRNAASVHLFYPLDDTVKTVSFYNEITVPANADPLHSYYMACGFARGYFGIQVNSPAERRVIFSVWDAGNEAVDRSKVPEENRVKLMAKGEEVVADDFGNEGTGGHSHWIYPWKTGVTYRFLVTAAADSAKATTSYAGYFFTPELQQWKLIACFKAPKDGKPLRRLYSFVENFEGSNGQLYRKSYFNSPWIRTDKGEWRSVGKASFSYDATGKAGHRIDYGGGVENNLFYLWNGGFRQNHAQYGQGFTRLADTAKPRVHL